MSGRYDTTEYYHRRWYPEDTPKDEINSRVFSEVERISQRTNRLEQIMDSIAVYGDSTGYSGLYGAASLNTLNSDLTHNIIAPAIDTLAAEITQSRQRPMVVTVGGTPRDQRNARHMTHFLDGKWDLDNIDSVTFQCVLDSLVCGMGFAHVYRYNELDPENDGTAVERIFPGNFLFDDTFAVDTIPREFYVRRFIDRAHLADLFPDFEQEIWDAQDSHRAWYSHYPQEQSDASVEVVEAFHLASAPGRKDGRRVISIRNAVLLDKPHGRVDTDYICLRGLPGRMGYWGESLALRAAPAQLELNKMCYRMQEGHHLLTTPKVFVNRQSNIIQTHLTNDIGDIVEYDGEPPIFYTPQAFNAEFYKHLERLESWVFKELGISELSAVSKKPTGLDSGAALRMYADIQTRRWINYVRRYERFNEDIARLVCLKEKEIAEENPNHSVTVFVKNKKAYEDFKWNEIDLDPERIRLRIFSASALPQTPAGKLQALEEMVKTGVIDQATFIRLADIPDFESVRDLLVAGETLMRESFEKLLEDPDFTFTPDPTLDLLKGRIMATQMAHLAELKGYKETDIQRLWDWIEDSYVVEDKVKEQEMLKQAAAIEIQRQQEMAAMPDPMQGAPGPPGSQLPGMSVLPQQPAAPPPFSGPITD